MLRQLKFFLEAVRNHKIRFKKDNKEDNIRENSNEENLKDSAIVMKNNAKTNFSAFLKAVAYKNRWFIFQDHPNDTHRKVQGIDSVEDIVIYLTNQIAKLVALYLFNGQTSINFTNDNDEKRSNTVINGSR